LSVWFLKRPCFVDFKKAFDRVNYWKLFRQLLDDGINANIVALLAFYYSHQEVSVRWRNVITDIFSIKNGTRQGGILSPFVSQGTFENCCKLL